MPQDYTQPPTAAQFVQDYPVFDSSKVTDPSAVQFSPAQINYWLQIAALMINQQYFSTLYYVGTEMFVAHHLALEAWAEQGGPQTIPGISKGPIASASSPEASVSYANAASMEMDAGHWNYTIYGGRFIRLCRTLCAGPLYVGAGCNNLGPWNGPAWPGPWGACVPNPND
jgi:hypothetical protein